MVPRGGQTDTVAYIAYGAQFAQGKSRLARGYAREAGFRFSDEFNTVAEWRNTQGGGCIATGIDGPLTGKGAHLLLVDDPHKDRVEAEKSEITTDFYMNRKGGVTADADTVGLPETALKQPQLVHLLSGLRFHAHTWPDGRTDNPRLCRACRLARGCRCWSCDWERGGRR